MENDFILKAPKARRETISLRNEPGVETHPHSSDFRRSGRISRITLKITQALSTVLISGLGLVCLAQAQEGYTITTSNENIAATGLQRFIDFICQIVFYAGLAVIVGGIIAYAFAQHRDDASGQGNAIRFIVTGLILASVGFIVNFIMSRSGYSI